MWSSAAVALLQDSTGCAFRDGIQHTLVIELLLPFYHLLPVCPFSSDINKTFSSIQLPLTGYFLFFGPLSVNPGDGCV